MRTFDLFLRTRSSAGWLMALAVAILVSSASVPSLAQTPAEAETGKGPPTAVGERFLQAFEKRDFATLRTLFAPGATVAAVWLAEAKVPTTMQAEEWLKVTEEELAGLETISIDRLETTSLSFADGSVVSVLFHSTGTVPGGLTFTNDGIDTYVLIETGEGWKILHYSYIEKLEMNPPGADAAD